MSELAIIFAGVLGLLIGSFLNVVIYRVPLGISIVSPRSSCPSCQKEINWFDNIPVLSWLLLQGRCRNCGSKISPRYPLVELATGLLFAFLTYVFVQSHPIDWYTTPKLLELIAYLAFFASTLALSVIDLEHFRLPTPIILFGLFFGLALLFSATIMTGSWDRFLVALACSGSAFGILLVIHLVVPNGMGLGDVRLAALLGLFLGWQGVGPTIIGMFLAFGLGAVFGILLMLFAGGNRKTQIPFGPWMVVGSWLGLLIGDLLWLAYWSLNGSFA